MGSSQIVFHLFFYLPYKDFFNAKNLRIINEIRKFVVKVKCLFSECCVVTEWSAAAVCGFSIQRGRISTLLIPYFPTYWWCDSSSKKKFRTTRKFVSSKTIIRIVERFSWRWVKWSNLWITAPRPLTAWVWRLLDAHRDEKRAEI